MYYSYVASRRKKNTILLRVEPYRLVWAAAPPAASFIFESCQLHFLYVGILCGPFFGKKHFSTAPEKIVSFLYPCTYSYLIFVYFFRTMTFFEADSFQPKWLFIHDNID